MVYKASTLYPDVPENSPCGCSPTKYKPTLSLDLPRAALEGLKVGSSITIGVTGKLKAVRLEEDTERWNMSSLTLEIQELDLPEDNEFTKMAKDLEK